MADQEKEVLDQEIDQETANLDEVKASFGVDAEVPDPVAKKAKAPGGDGKEAKHDNAPTAVKPGKVKMINAMVSAMKGMKTEELETSYNKIMSALKVEGFEEETSQEEQKISVREIKKITAEDVNVSEDVAAMFGGQTDLSEEFVSKATTIFEAAVVSKVNSILESVTIDLEAEMEAEKQSIVESMTNRLDEYLEYVAEEWMKENELAVEQGIRAEITENFMVGLRDLFKENYIDIPDEKVDLVDELAQKVTELETSVNEEMEKSIELRKELVEMKKSNILGEVSKGLTESQVEKLSSLAEGVEFEDAQAYEKKLETLKETYFPKEQNMNEEIESLDEEPLEIDEVEKPVDPGMRAYLDAISRTIRK